MAARVIRLGSSRVSERWAMKRSLEDRDERRPTLGHLVDNWDWTLLQSSAYDSVLRAALYSWLTLDGFVRAIPCSFGEDPRPKKLKNTN